MRTSAYDSGALLQVERDYELVTQQLEADRTWTATHVTALHAAKAREYLTHGVGRRLGLLERCLVSIFRVFPPRRSNLLSREELTDVDINLHAFVINIQGFLDNLAWVALYERGLAAKLDRKQVGLFNKKTHVHLPAGLPGYLTSPPISTWHAKYAKEFRDALAHRIPLYVPPSCVTEDEARRENELNEQLLAKIKAHDFVAAEAIQEELSGVGSICAAFLHSYGKDEADPAVVLHPQLIVDAKTALEILRHVLLALGLRSLYRWTLVITERRSGVAVGGGVQRIRGRPGARPRHAPLLTNPYWAGIW